MNVGPLINLPGSSQTQVAVSPDGLSLYFQSDRPGGFGSSDLYVSHRDSKDAPWGEPQNLGPSINSAANEVATAISPDGETLFFIREPSQVFVVGTDVIARLRPP